MKPLKTLFRVEPKVRGDNGEWLKKHLTPAQFAKFRSERGRLFADSVEKLENYGHGKSTHTTYKVEVPEVIAQKAARQHPDGFTEYLLPKKYVRKKSEFSMHEFATITRLRDRIAFVKSLRRQLEKKAKGGHSSHTITGIRSVFAPNTKRHGGMTDKALPRAVKVDGQPAILHYRGTGKSTPELLRRPVLETQKWAGGPDPSKVEIVLPSRRARPSQWQSKFADKKTVARPGVHYQKTNVSKAAYYHAHGSEHPTGLISTSVGKKVASNWAVSQGEKAGVLGVYATKARDLLRKKRKAAMVSSWVGEREIAQATGGNMIARRRLKTVPAPEGQWDLRRFARIDSRRLEMSRRENLAKQRRQDPIGREAGIPLTGQIAHDRYVIENRQKDIAKRDSNILRAGVAGAAAGAVLGRGRLPLKARLAAGALAGAGSVIGVRAVTHKTGRDVYGARQPWAARSEAAPAVIGAGAAGYGAYRILRKKFLKMSDARFEFAKKEKRQMNPYVMAGLSGAASGAALGILPLLRRGVALKTALRTAAGGAAAGGTIVGGGSLLGSAILGDPDKKEGAAFTKRAAVGGAIVGGTLGVAGGLVARRVPVVRKQIGKLSREWRPAQWIKKSGPVKAAAIGGVAGGAYGAATGADEGQQVDSIRNIRKDLKRMHGFEFSNNKDWRDARRESRSEAAKDYMAGGGMLAAGLGVGAGAGYLGWRGGKAANQVAATAKEASKATRSVRVAGAKINRASTWIKRQMTTFPTFRKLRIRLEATTAALEFEKPFSGYNKKRHARTGGLNDSYRKQYNREHGSNLKRPVTTEPSKLKPGSKSAKRRASFCARMGGMPGPTSKDGKLTPKGAALKRWNCSTAQQLIEMNDRTYRPGSTAEMRSMKKTPAVKEILKKENARGAWKHRLRTMMKVLPFEARYEFQTMAPMASAPVYDERERLKRQLLVTGAVATPVAGVGYAGWRSLRKSASAMRLEEDRRNLGQKLRAERRASMAVGGQAKANKFGPRGPISREPLSMRKSLQPDTLERNNATNKAIGVGKRYEQEINNRYRAGKKMKFVHSRGERMKMRTVLAGLRSKYKFARSGALHEFNIYTRDAETGRAASFWDQVQGRRLTRKNPLTGEVEDAPITTGSFISAARRKAEEYNRTRKRGMGLARDISEVAQGKKTKKREWEKGWFQNKLQTIGGAAALLGAGVVYRKGGLRSAPNWAKSFRRGTDRAIAKAQTVRATAEDRFGKILGLSARLRNSTQYFDYYQGYYDPQGWDLRDARGNSARVFSPKAKKRVRRPAEWYEKKQGERKILGGLAVAGTVGGVAAGLLIGRGFKPKGYAQWRPTVVPPPSVKGKKRRAASNQRHWLPEDLAPPERS